MEIPTLFDKIIYGNDSFLVFVLVLFTFISYCKAVYSNYKKKAKRTYSISLGGLTLLWVIIYLVTFDFESSFRIFDPVIYTIIYLYVFTFVFWTGLLTDYIIEEKAKKESLKWFKIVLFLIPAILSIILLKDYIGFIY